MVILERSGDGTTLTISGAGEMKNYGYETPWKSFRGSISSLVIEQGITSICSMAFQYFDALTSVNIGNSVKSIGDYAFNNCSALTSVNIPNSVTSVGRDAFGECSALTSINIPNSVTLINDDLNFWLLP